MDLQIVFGIRLLDIDKVTTGCAPMPTLNMAVIGHHLLMHIIRLIILVLVRDIMLKQKIQETELMLDLFVALRGNRELMKIMFNIFDTMGL